MVEKPYNLIKTIFWTGFLVGTLDILAAAIQTLIHGGDPMNMLRFIASGVFGDAAFKGGTSIALFGLLFHFIIAFCWTALFFLAYPVIKKKISNPIPVAIGYGVFIWLIMRFAVLPLSQTPSFPVKLEDSVVSIIILIIAIGAPLTYIAQKLYSPKEPQK